MIFLPLNDTEPNRYSGPPIVTLVLILINFLVMVFKPFLWEVFTTDLYTIYGSVPQFLINEQGGGALATRVVR